MEQAVIRAVRRASSARQKARRLATSVVVICLTVGILFCVVGCKSDDEKTGVVYRYESNSFTDTYYLYEDGSYTRTYRGTNTSNQDLENGSYKTTSSSVTFSVEYVTEVWPNEVSCYWIPLLTNSYSGTLTDGYLNISGTRYKKSGTVHSSK